MIKVKAKKFIEWFTRLPPKGGSTSKLTIDTNLNEDAYKIRKIYIFLVKTWLVLTTILMIFSNAKNIYPRNSKNEFLFTSFPLEVMTLVLFLVVILVAIWVFLHSTYSPIKKWKLESLLRRFTVETNLLSHHKGTLQSAKTVTWSYSVSKEKIEVNLLSGGHMSYELEKDIPRRLQGFLKKETIEKWTLYDVYFEIGLIQMVFLQKDDERIIIDDLNKIEQSEMISIRLTELLSWDVKKQAQIGVFGKTGSGKTSLIKAIMISYLATNQKNTVMIIDGKDSFLAQAGRYAKIPTATTSEEVLALLDSAVSIMNYRYKKMNANLEDENDTTYIEKFSSEGNILIVCDELLSLASATQASDKLKKPSDRLMPQISDRILTLIVKSRQASMNVLVSGQAFPASLLGDSIARSNLGLMINLGYTSQIQSQELFGMSLKDLPIADTANYGGIIFMDGLNWERPKEFLSPYFDDKKLPFKETLSKLIKARGGGSPQA